MTTKDATLTHLASAHTMVGDALRLLEQASARLAPVRAGVEALDAPFEYPDLGYAEIREGLDPDYATKRAKEALSQREVRRDWSGVAVPCQQPGCYQAGLEPDGKCKRHGAKRWPTRAAFQRMTAAEVNAFLESIGVSQRVIE